MPREWEAIHRNEPLRREITELMLMASDLNIIDWVKPEATRPRALSWDKTKRTTAKVNLTDDAIALRNIPQSFAIASSVTNSELAKTCINTTLAIVIRHRN